MTNLSIQPVSAGARIFDLNITALSLHMRTKVDAQLTSEILLLVLILTTSLSGFELSGYLPIFISLF